MAIVLVSGGFHEWCFKADDALARCLLNDRIPKHVAFPFMNIFQGSVEGYFSFRGVFDIPGAEAS